VPAGRQEEVRSEAYSDVRCNDERPHPPSERGLCSRKLRGEVRKGGVPPSEESLRRRWAFFNSLSRRDFAKPEIKALPAHTLERGSIASPIPPKLSDRDSLSRGDLARMANEPPFEALRCRF